MSALWPLLLCSLALLILHSIRDWSMALVELGLTPVQLKWMAWSLLTFTWMADGLDFGVYALAASPFCCVPWRKSVYRLGSIIRCAVLAFGLAWAVDYLGRFYPYESMLGLDFDVWRTLVVVAGVHLFAMSNLDKTWLLLCIYAATMAAAPFDPGRDTWVKLTTGYWVAYLSVASFIAARSRITLVISRLTKRWI